MIRPWRSARSKGTAETRPRRHRRRGEGKFKRGSEHAGKSAQRYRQREILQTLLIRSATSFDELVAQPFPLKVAFLSRLVETNDVGRVAICAIPPERENRGLPAKLPLSNSIHLMNLKDKSRQKACLQLCIWRFRPTCTLLEFSLFGINSEV